METKQDLDLGYMQYTRFEKEEDDTVRNLEKKSSFESKTNRDEVKRYRNWRTKKLHIYFKW